jgi:uncharacterized protein YxjI
LKNLLFPLHFQFKVTTLSNDFTATDAEGRTIAYVRQRMLRFKEEVNVYKGENRSEEAFVIKANQWIDFSATYTFSDVQGREVGSIARKGWSSLWRARYELFDQNQRQDLLIREENVWAKIMDGLMGEIPVLNILTGYLFHPSYLVTRPNGTLVARLKKRPSFWGRKFKVDKLGEFEEGEEDRVLLGLMMMILLERRRG